MKKYIVLACISLLLIACSSLEKQMESIATEHLKETFHLNDDMKIISVEKVTMPIHPLVSTLDILINGRDYNVVLEVDESIPFQFDMVINRRSKEVKTDNYIETKHEVFQKENDEYIEMINQLEQFGVEEIQLHDVYFDRSKRTVRNDIELNELNIDTERFVEILDTMAKMMLENIDTNMSINFSVNTNEYEKVTKNGERQDEFTTNLQGVSIPTHNRREYEDFIKLIDEQLYAIDAAERIDEDFIEQLDVLEKEYGVSFPASKIEYIDVFAENKEERELIRHEISFHAPDEYDAKDLLGVVHFLDDNGFGDSYIDFYIPGKTADFQLVKDLNTLENINLYKNE